LLGFALAALAALAAPAAKPRPTAEVARFSFGWADGQRVRVTATTAVERTSQPESGATLQYDLVLRRSGDEFRAGAQALEFLLPGAGANEPPRRVPVPFRQAAIAMAEFRVGNDGLFLGLVDLPGVQRQLRELLQSEPSRAQDPARAEAALAAATDPQLMTGAAAEYWEPVIGAWVGAEFALDAEYAFENEFALQMFGIPALRSDGRVFVRRAPPCQRAGQPRRCVYLEATETIDPAVLRQAVLDALARAPGGGPPPGAAIEAISLAVTTTLLIEPDGLFPHEYEMEKAVRLTPAGPNSPGEQRILQTEHRRYEYGASGGAPPSPPSPGPSNGDG
jgi:hypothetical protein